MNECMEIDKPLISIVMAVYEPNMQWLKEQLLSLEAQTYPNLELIIRDDCSPTVPFEQICECAATCIRSFPYEISRNEHNVGSNQTFEWLTQQARGEYIAYCDQDDVWLPEKLQILKNEIEQTGALLVCSDMYVIDGQGRQTADSITKVRRHHVFHSGTGLADKLLFRNFVTGCTMLMRAQEAKAAIPFCPYMVHDHYLALWCAAQGEILSLSQCLVNYRIHRGNQTGLMAGVTDKDSYGTERIKQGLARMQWLEKNFSCGSMDLAVTIHDACLWMQARNKNWFSRGGIRVILKYRKFSLLPSVSEIFLKYVPDTLFMKIIEIARKNYI